MRRKPPIPPTVGPLRTLVEIRTRREGGSGRALNLTLQQLTGLP